MKNPKFLKVQESTTSSFDIRYEKVPYFSNPWHYHPELELTLVIQSTGIRFVGDSVERFEAGDLVLLGSNLPHYWRNDSDFYKEQTTQFAEAIILRFKIDFIGKPMLDLPEMTAVKQLFERASQGIWFDKGIVGKLKTLMLQLYESRGVERMIFFLEIFKNLGQTADFRVLSTKSFGGKYANGDSDRINQMLFYIHTHLQENIKLETMAALANMNTTAFCRYVKKQTNKTFIELLNDIRIANACRLLLDGQRDIAEMCFECGFENVTHFNYTFKKITGENPTEYRKRKMSK